MLIYHPAYDAYHCVFRSLLITESINSLEVERLRILDFFLSFPAEIRHIRLPREHSDAKKIAQKLTNEYRGPVNLKQAFRDMEQIQLAAYTTLAASGVFSATHLERDIVYRTDTTLTKDFQDILEKSKTSDRGALDYIINGLASLPLLGENGLKHRTGLMEHRYDVV